MLIYAPKLKYRLVLQEINCQKTIEPTIKPKCIKNAKNTNQLFGRLTFCYANAYDQPYEVINLQKITQNTHIHKTKSNNY